MIDETQARAFVAALPWPAKKRPNLNLFREDGPAPFGCRLWSMHRPEKVMTCSPSPETALRAALHAWAINFTQLEGEALATLKRGIDRLWN